MKFLEKYIGMYKYMLNFECNQLREKVSCSAKIENLLKTIVSNADNPKELEKWIRIDINDLFSVSLSWEEIQDKYGRGNEYTCKDPYKGN